VVAVKPYYSDDHVTIYHGDCLELSDLWTCADVLVTDPPYGVAYVSGGPRVNAFGVRSVTERKAVANDADVTARDKVLKLWGGRPALVFGSWKRPRPADVVDRLIWFKRNTNPGLGTNTPWSPADEEIYVLGTGWVGTRTLGVIPTDEARAGSGGLAAEIGHPTPKPLDLMRHLLERTTGVVADPFMGSGSTLRAAKDLGRRAIGIELEERYCEIAAKRCAQEVLAL
jgi:site-specific DNA-methyltransferase (adenine-specific)